MAMNVLFIGNSFTARNDMPGIVGRLASADGRSFRHRLISAGGASLRRHWNAREARREISEGGYDHVVLQEQSTLPVKNAARMHENVRLFDAEIRASGASTALYMTWARQHAPSSQAAISKAYIGIAAELDATLLPVGTAWQDCLGRRGAPKLYDRDGSHPTPAGSYLAACVIYLVLARTAVVPAESDLPGADAGEMESLRAAAERVVGRRSGSRQMRGK